MSSLLTTDAAQLARSLPGCLARERALLPALEHLGVADGELRVLLGDQQLLEILAEESLEQSAEASRAELKRVLAWHEARLARVAAQVTHAEH